MSSSSSARGWSIKGRCLVTGGSGFVGQRLVEMLVDRGAARVVSFDIAPKPKNSSNDPKIQYIKGDLVKYQDVEDVCRDCDIVFHIAALVGPYWPEDKYEEVNFNGTENVLTACRKLGIKRIVMSSSPSTRFPYPDPNIDYLTEDQLYEINKGDFAPVFLQPYAKVRAKRRRSKEQTLLYI